ncbi:hypothetical protein GWI33_006218 [Rhynchophorus ferrugineus]|uniref:Serine/threonine-protein phosphatase 4 regulatory subunit 2 n=1 Tax=Rhynchophorus ferrugineus TaxID=354439 RepID=A0A834MFN2_RHYFE|nr:hypothetical protein GWI33_006218 [Rhynchophorus ferrugineus]
MENPEEILHSLEEFAKMKPKDIPRELEEYLRFVAKTGDPIYQWSAIKSLFREKLINVITEFYESCTSMEIPPCPNVEIFNYDLMKNFILEKLDTFSSAPFTLQRICELLTTPHKEYTRIDKYMRALEKNILVVSTMEPGGRRTENGEGIMNGIESDHDHVPEPGNEINVVEIDNSLLCPQNENEPKCPVEEQEPFFQKYVDENIYIKNEEFSNSEYGIETSIDSYSSEKVTSEASTSSQEIVCVQYVSIGPLSSSNLPHQSEASKEDVSVTITAVNIERVSETHVSTASQDSCKPEDKDIDQQTEQDHKTNCEPEKINVQSSEPAPSEMSEPDSCENATEMVTDTIKLESSDDQSSEMKVTDENNSSSSSSSSETSISCSESSPNQSDASSNSMNIENSEISKSINEDSTENLPPSELSCQRSDQIRMDTVDSTTTADIKEADQITEDHLDPQPKIEEPSTPESSVAQDQKSEADSSTVCKDGNIQTQNVERPSEATTEHSMSEASQKETEGVSSVSKVDVEPMEVDGETSEKQAVVQEAESSELAA